MPDPQFLFGPVPHQEAIDFIKSKPVVARDVFDGLLPELKARAFTITGLDGLANVMQGVRDRIAELPAGADWEAARKDIANDVSRFMVDPNADPEERDAQINAAFRRAELLLRTHGFQAYQAAQFQVMDRQKDVLPYWQYVTMEDDRVRPEHAALNGIVLPADSPFWHNHFPPWDWGCRCQCVPLSQWDRDDIAKQDKDRASDNKLVLDAIQQQHLVNGTLVRAARTYDVRSPVQKEGGSGYSWDPRTLRLSLDELKSRYDAQTWSEFEAWARKTPLGENQPTVWEWLGGKPAAPAPIAPVAGKTPPPLPTPAKPTLDEFVARHTAQPGKMTEEEAGKFVAALKQSHGVKTADKVDRISIGKMISPQWKTYVSGIIQEFLDIIPRDILDALPNIKIRVMPKMSANTLGEYDTRKKILSINEGRLAGDAGEIKRVLFHELAHWMHLHGPSAYKIAILGHFNMRTAGESTGPLPNYGRGTRGKKDKFWDTYMGREYTGVIDGCEIPTKVFELLSNPTKLSQLWNLPLHRETIKVALAILFNS